MLKFGLTTYFKNPLMTAVNNAGPFVLMFDESLNGWLCPVSLSGSQFMGHSTSDIYSTISKQV